MNRPGPQKAVKPQLEVMVHAPGHAVHRAHADFLRRVRILPYEVLIHKLGNCSRDVPLLALVLDRDAERADDPSAAFAEKEGTVIAK